MPEAWYAVPDESREAWCFLTVETEEQANSSLISGWQVGYGNPVRFVREESLSSGKDVDEKQVLRELFEELDSVRYTGTTLITPNQETLRQLRTRMIVCRINPDYSLRGFNHIDLSHLLERYFTWNAPFNWKDIASIFEGQQKEENTLEEPTRVEQLWLIRQRLNTLVPVDSLVGIQL